MSNSGRSFRYPNDLRFESEEVERGNETGAAEVSVDDAVCRRC